MEPLHAVDASHSDTHGNEGADSLTAGSYSQVPSITIDRLVKTRAIIRGSIPSLRPVVDMTAVSPPTTITR